MARHIHIHVPEKDSISGVVNKGAALIRHGSGIRAGLGDAGTTVGAKRGHLTKRLPKSVKVHYK